MKTPVKRVWGQQQTQERKFISNILIVEKYLTVDGRQNKQEDRTRSARTRPATIRRRSRSSRSRARCGRRSTRSGRTKCQLTNWWTASHFYWRDVKGKDAMQSKWNGRQTWKNMTRREMTGRMWLKENDPKKKRKESDWKKKDRKWLVNANDSL